jgi:hypothetical protein
VEGSGALGENGRYGLGLAQMAEEGGRGYCAV